MRESCRRRGSLAMRSPCGVLARGFFAWGRRLDLAVAVTAVHRPLAARHERDFGHLAALGAARRVHLARRLPAEAGEVAVAHVPVVLLQRALARPPRRTARLTARG